MSNIIYLDTAELRAVYNKYASLHTDMITASMQKPCGLERSTAAATEAAGTIGEGISGLVGALGELGDRMWGILKYYQDVDAYVAHDLSKYPE